MNNQERWECDGTIRLAFATGNPKFAGAADEFMRKRGLDAEAITERVRCAVPHADPNDWLDLLAMYDAA